MTAPDKALTVSDYMRKPAHLARFVEVLGNEREAQMFVQSVLIEAASDEKLRECTPQSIYKSALRAASLGLSCDKSLKQAWIIAYSRNIGTKQNPKWVKEAQFQPHYKGLHTLAMRTGKYWTINVSPVYDGQRVMENPLTGLHSIVEPGGLVGQPRAYTPGLVDVTSRRRQDLKVIGWLAYFKTKKGYEKSVYMSCADIDDHARRHVKDYDKNQNQNWTDADKRATMEMKTVLRQLLSWADLTGTENAKLVEALQADTAPEETIDAPAEDIQEGEAVDAEPMNIDQARKTMGTIKGKEKKLGNCAADELNLVYLNDPNPTAQEAARIILKEDFRMDPPKRTKEQAVKDLGF